MPQPTPDRVDGGSAPIDRLAPTRRPARRAVMRQGWQELMFLHWALPPASIRPLITGELELDLFEGMAYVGLVAFTMTGVRPVGLPAVPGLSNFHETNVRTYVHHRGRDPGVWFFSLDAANSVAVRLARGLFHLPYHRSRMFLERERLDSPAGTTPQALRRSEALAWPNPGILSDPRAGRRARSATPARYARTLLGRALSPLHPEAGPALPGASPSPAIPSPAGRRALPRREPAGRCGHRPAHDHPARTFRRRRGRRRLSPPPTPVVRPLRLTLSSVPSEETVCSSLSIHQDSSTARTAAPTLGRSSRSLVAALLATASALPLVPTWSRSPNLHLRPPGHQLASRCAFLDLLSSCVGIAVALLESRKMMLCIYTDVLLR